jgi:hypothetical protein
MMVILSSETSVGQSSNPSNYGAIPGNCGKFHEAKKVVI